MTYTRESQHTQVYAAFTYHKPTDEQVKRMQLIRDSAKNLAHLIVENSPVSTEQSRALNALDEAVMLTNAAIARKEVIAHQEERAETETPREEKKSPYLIDTGEK